MADLYVPGLDLSTGRVVQPDEREVWEWHEKGHNGDRTLVCLECYHGAGNPGGQRQLVPLVPRGRINGARRKHFAHPPGMAPVGGHSPETAWHWEAKHRLRQWIEESTGARAEVEAWTMDGRRRSDVAVTFPGGARLAIEVQLSQMTDTELLARRKDYARLGTALAWVWSADKRVPHVLFQFGEPGWVFDPANDQLGLVCGQAHLSWPADRTAARNRSPHWPPCPGDEIELRWMPLSSVRLTRSGFLPSAEVIARLKEEAADAARRADAERTAAARLAAPTADPGDLQAGRVPRPSDADQSRAHLALRIDGRPPWSHPLARLYWCPRCGFLTGEQLHTSRIQHEIPGPDRWITGADLEPDA